MYRKTVLENGLTVVTESIPYFSTVSLGIWWKTGEGSRTKRTMAFLILSSICSSRVLRNDQHMTLPKKLMQLAEQSMLLPEKNIHASMPVF